MESISVKVGLKTVIKNVIITKTFFRNLFSLRVRDAIEYLLLRLNSTLKSLFIYRMYQLTERKQRFKLGPDP